MPAALATSVPCSSTLPSLGFCERTTSRFSAASWAIPSQSPFQVLFLSVTLPCRLCIHICHLFSLQTPGRLQSQVPSLCGAASCSGGPSQMRQHSSLWAPQRHFKLSRSSTDLSLFRPKHVPPRGFPIFKKGTISHPLAQVRNFQQVHVR